MTYSYLAGYYWWSIMTRNQDMKIDGPGGADIDKDNLRHG